MVSDRKLNLVQNLKFLTLFQVSGTQEREKKIKVKQEILHKTSFRQNRFSFIGVTQKRITV